MLIFVDIDNTICTSGDPADYSTAVPIVERILKVNELFDDGNTIVYWTARGTMTGKNWYLVTKNQLERWNAKHHELRLGKPAYDLFIDDKNINSEVYFR